MASPLPPRATSSALPVPLTAFVGRERELSAVRRQLADARLLTLTGAGGSGKTRLALAAAAAITHESGAPDVAWIELASLEDASALVTHVARELGVRAEGGGTLMQAIIAAVQERETLLVLDNCEHLVDACAQLVDSVLRACSTVRVLATSREALGVSGERSWLVPALTLPVDDVTRAVDALESGAVQLFAERARDVLPNFAVTNGNAAAIAQICRRLDGLPLAIELAAARSAVLTPQQIAERLDDRFGLLTSGGRTALPRHRTLRAAVDWSYDLLTDTERLLFQRLSVFAGGFTLDAAETICADDALPPRSVLELLSALVSRSLVTMDEEDGRARYRLLETIREYAVERRANTAAAADTPDLLHARHADYHLALVRSIESDVILGRANRLRQLDLEHDNLRAALSWSAERGLGTTVGLPITWAMTWYWFHRQLWHEGFRAIARALETSHEPPDALRAAALHGLSIFGLYRAEPGTRDRLEEAVRLWERIGNQRWASFSLTVSSIEASIRRAPDDARRHAERAVAAARGAGGSWEVAVAIAHALVPATLWAGDWNSASALLAEADRIYRAHNYDIGIAYVLDARAYVAYQLGDDARAARLAVASLQREPTGQNRWLAGRSLRTLGALANRRGDVTHALQLFGAAAAMYEAIGAHAITEERQSVNGIAQLLRESISAVDFDSAFLAGRAMSFRDAVAFGIAGAPRDSTLPVDVADESTSPGSADDMGTAAARVVANYDGALQPSADGAVIVEEAARDAASSIPLYVRTLGQLEIVRDDIVVPDDAWAYAKPRELLLYLLAHPDGRTREQIGLAFWPDVSSAQVKNNFHVTLHHVRKALGGNEWVRFERGRYRIATETGVREDAAQFEAAIVHGLKRLAAESEDPSRAEVVLHALTEALSWYRGPYLEGESVGDWHLERRDRLARLYEEALVSMGSYLNVEGRHAEAAAHFRQLLAADPLHEEAARMLMLSLARDRKRAEALRTYDQLREQLRRELDTEPGADIRTIAERLRAGASV